MENGVLQQDIFFDTVDLGRPPGLAGRDRDYDYSNRKRAGAGRGLVSEGLRVRT